MAADKKRNNGESVCKKTKYTYMTTLGDRRN